MISEGSRDTEDWSNDDRINYILKYIQIENSYFKFINISQYCFYFIFDQINAGLMNETYVFQKNVFE